MKKKLMLLLFVVTMFLGTGVLAKDKIGYCNYNTAKVYVYSDGSITAEAPWHNPSISDTYKNQISGQGKCYSYMYINRSGVNTATFSNERDTESGDEYVLLRSNEKETNCFYDIKSYNDDAYDTWIRLNIKRPANGSRIFISTLGSGKKYSEISLSSLADGNIVNLSSYRGTIDSSNIVTYNEANSIQTRFGINSLIDLYEAMSGSTCPTLYYETYNQGGTKGVYVTTVSDVGYSYANANGKYYYVYSDGEKSQVNDGGATEGRKEEIICDKNGGLKKDGKELTYNFRIIKDTADTYQWCVEIDNSYQCTTGQYGLDSNLFISATDAAESTYQIKFKLDTDMHDYIKNISSGKSQCPNYVGTYYNDTEGLYMITTDPDKATYSMKDGRNLDTGGVTQTDAKKRIVDDPGKPVSGCEGLIGENTLRFLNSILNVIMIAGPIIGVLLGTYELITAMAAGDDDAKKKGIKRLQNRLIASALLLLVPYIVKLILNIAGKSNSADCIDAMKNLAILRSNLF